MYLSVQLVGYTKGIISHRMVWTTTKAIFLPLSIGNIFYKVRISRSLLNKVPSDWEYPIKCFLQLKREAGPVSKTCYPIKTKVQSKKVTSLRHRSSPKLYKVEDNRSINTARPSASLLFTLPVSRNASLLQLMRHCRRYCNFTSAETSSANRKSAVCTRRAH
jgi:hypothetical protein